MGLVFWGDLYYGYDDIRPDIERLASCFNGNRYALVLNLEGAYPENTSHKIKKRGEHLAQSERTFEVLNRLNVVGVSLCNNHIFDFGTQGLKNTLSMLESNNISVCGVVLSDTRKYPYMDIVDGENTYRIYAATDPFEESVCSADGGTGCCTICDLLKKEIPKYSKNWYNIAFLHTGFEYNTVPAIRTIKECRHLIDNGFDYVICSHPHISQPYEIYKGRPIFYSLGNFYFSEFRKEFHRKKIKPGNRGACDLGVGIAIDGRNYKNIFVEYNDETDDTSIVDGVIHRLEFNSVREYTREYRKNRNNHNPILMGDKLDNAKMWMMNRIYSVYGVYRKIARKV